MYEGGVMRILDWPEAERPREKLINHGASALSDAELLAILIRTGTKGKTALDIARELLNSFGHLQAVLQADLATFIQQPGVGPQTYALIQAAYALGQRRDEQILREAAVFTNSLAVRRFVRAKLGHHKREVVACLCLDIQHRLICFTELFQGTLTQAPIYPREVVSHALSHQAAAIILCHNHPAGLAQPSKQDLSVTALLRSALELVDIQLIDHLIVGEQALYSFAEHGDL
jgi:DNA repair protein RadC